VLVGQPVAVPEVRQALSNVFQLLTQLGIQVRRWRFLAEAFGGFLALAQGDQFFFPAVFQLGGYQTIGGINALVTPSRHLRFVGRPLHLLLPVALDLVSFKAALRQEGLQRIQLGGLHRVEERVYHQGFNRRAVHRGAHRLGKCLAQPIANVAHAGFVHGFHDVSTLATGG